MNNCLHSIVCKLCSLRFLIWFAAACFAIPLIFYGVATLVLGHIMEESGVLQFCRDLLGIGWQMGVLFVCVSVMRWIIFGTKMPTANHR